MADEAQDVQTAVETQETTTPTPSAEETKAPEVARGDILEALSDEKPKEEPKTEEPAEAKTEDTPKEDPTEKKGEEPETEEQPRGKKDANQRIRQLVARNKELEAQIEQRNAQVYKPQTVDELVAEGESEAMAHVKVMQQEREIEAFNRQVTDLNNTIDHEANKVLEDLPIFNPDSDEYKADNGQLAERVAELYEKQIHRDPRTGIVVSATYTPYEFYKAFADVKAEAMKAGETNGKIEGQRATAQMLASAEPPTSTAPRGEKKDPIMEALTSSD
jgi:hypothetical protein